MYCSSLVGTGLVDGNDEDFVLLVGVLVVAVKTDEDGWLTCLPYLLSFNLSSSQFSFTQKALSARVILNHVLTRELWVGNTGSNVRLLTHSLLWGTKAISALISIWQSSEARTFT